MRHPRSDATPRICNKSVERSFLILTLAVCSILVFGSASCSQGIAADVDSDAAPKSEIRIRTFYVIDAENDRPISGASIRAKTLGDGEEFRTLGETDEQGKLRTELRTDENLVLICKRHYFCAALLEEHLAYEKERRNVALAEMFVY